METKSFKSLDISENPSVSFRFKRLLTFCIEEAFNETSINHENVCTCMFGILNVLGVSKLLYTDNSLDITHNKIIDAFQT